MVATNGTGRHGNSVVTSGSNEMGSPSSHTTTEYTGRVARVNERGVLFEGQQAWRNISKFAGAIALPSVGATVTVELDKSGFIRAIQPVVAEAAPVGEPRQNRGSGAQEPVSEAPDRERLIVRQSCLKAAATVFTYRPEAPLDDILAFASAFEQWVLR